MTLTSEGKSELLDSLCGRSLDQSAEILARELDLELKTAPQVQIQKDRSVRLELTLSEAQWQKLQKARELLSHSLPYGNWDQVLEHLCDRLIQQKTKLRKDRACVSEVKNRLDQGCASILKGSGEQGCASEMPNPKDRPGPSKVMAQIARAQASTTKVAPATFSSVAPQREARTAERMRPSLRKSILNRDQCCQWRDPRTQKQCASTWQLQVDHRQPQWAGGLHQAGNLQILCGPHNRLKYSQEARIQRKFTASPRENGLQGISRAPSDKSAFMR